MSAKRGGGVSAKRGGGVSAERGGGVSAERGGGVSAKRGGGVSAKRGGGVSAKRGGGVSAERGGGGGAKRAATTPTRRSTKPTRAAEHRPAPRRDAAPPRRTQAARRADTQQKLLDAAAAVLIDRGYAEVTVQRVSAHAGVSQGGLFRHYATMEALMVAVAVHLGDRILAHYQREFRRLEGREEPLALALALLREACRSHPNLAWYELMVAARTRPALRAALRPIIRRYHDDIAALAAQILPHLAAQLGDAFAVLVETIVCIFDGEALHRFVLESPDVDAARLALLPTLLVGATADAVSAAGPASRSGRGPPRARSA